MNQTKLDILYNIIKETYNDVEYLPFHGWHHIEFVYKKSKIFAEDLNANTVIVQSAALVHDLNYIETSGNWSRSSVGKNLRQNLLQKANYNDAEIDRIEDIVHNADIQNRLDQSLSSEEKALSDADTLFKALPITSPVFTARFLSQTGYDLEKLADKILTEQLPLLKKGQYFYSNLGNQKYLEWAETSLRTWQQIKKALSDKDIRNLL